MDSTCPMPRNACLSFNITLICVIFHLLIISHNAQEVQQTSLIKGRCQEPQMSAEVPVLNYLLTDRNGVILSLGGGVEA